MNNKNLVIAAVLALVPAALSLFLESTGNTIGEFGIAFLFPGMLASIAMSGNAHAFHLWVAALANFLLYFLLCWAIAALIGRAHRRLIAPSSAKNP